MGIPGGFCGITPPRTRTVLGPTVRRPPTFRQPTIRVSSFSHHQPAVMAITVDSGPLRRGGVILLQGPALAISMLHFCGTTNGSVKYLTHLPNYPL
jgi:hypothetical protein